MATEGTQLSSDWLFSKVDCYLFVVGLVDLINSISLGLCVKPYWCNIPVVIPFVVLDISFQFMIFRLLGINGVQPTYPG